MVNIAPRGGASVYLKCPGLDIRYAGCLAQRTVCLQNGRGLQKSFLQDGVNLHAEYGLDLISGVLVDFVRNENLRGASVISQLFSDKSTVPEHALTSGNSLRTNPGISLVVPVRNANLREANAQVSAVSGTGFSSLRTGPAISQQES